MTTTTPDGKVLSIVIPVFNKWNFTKACLEDLFQLPHDHEIILVDNNSTDETNMNMVQIERELHQSDRLKYIRNSENYGFAKACNIGYDNATSDNVLFLNNDIRVKSNHTDWTKDLIALSNRGLVGPTMGQLDKDFNFVQEADNVMLEGNSYMGGWCLASSKTFWDQLIINKYKGPFSEEFGIAYFEDTDLSFRAKLLGIHFNLVTIPVVHFGKQTSKQLNVHKLYSEARKIFIDKWKSK